MSNGSKLQWMPAPKPPRAKHCNLHARGPDVSKWAVWLRPHLAVSSASSPRGCRAHIRVVSLPMPSRRVQAEKPSWRPFRLSWQPLLVTARSRSGAGAVEATAGGAPVGPPGPAGAGGVATSAPGAACGAPAWPACRSCRGVPP